MGHKIGWHPGPVIEGVFFDGDQTLWDFEVLMRRALASTLDYLRESRPGRATSSLDVESVVDRRLFDIAADHIAVPSARLAMVGDSLTHDVAGAQHAGWHGIWLNRGRRGHPDEVLPDAELDTLRDLPAVLAAMR
jgi:phosphoglycolate phosphatase-like HAD superfamily hydrolase